MTETHEAQVARLNEQARAERERLERLAEEDESAAAASKYDFEELCRRIGLAVVDGVRVVDAAGGREPPEPVILVAREARQWELVEGPFCARCGHDRHDGACITIGPPRYPGNCACPGDAREPVDDSTARCVCPSCGQPHPFKGEPLECVHEWGPFEGAFAESRCRKCGALFKGEPPTGRASGSSANERSGEIPAAPGSPASPRAAAPERVIYEEHHVYSDEPSTMKGQVMPSEDSRGTSLHTRGGKDVLPRVPVTPEGRDSVTNARAAAAPECPQCPVRDAAQQAAYYLDGLDTWEASLVGGRTLAGKLKAALAAPCVPAGPEPTIAGFRVLTDASLPPDVFVVRHPDGREQRFRFGSPPERGTAAP